METSINPKQIQIYKLSEALENPQSMESAPLKLSLDNNVLTLKAGSKIIVPAGVENNEKKFTTVTTTTDITLSSLLSSGNDQVVCYSNGALFTANVTSMHSRTSDSGVYNALLYNSTTNLISNRVNNVETQTNVSFPLCFVKVSKETGESSYTVKAILKRFDYTGYIGKFVFVNPGLNIRIPNGYNEDGSYKNIAYTTNSVLITEASSENTQYELAIKLDNNTPSLELNYLSTYYTSGGSFAHPYVLIDNVVYKSNKPTLSCPFINFFVKNQDSGSGYISEFNVYSATNLDMMSRPKAFKIYLGSETDMIGLTYLIKYKIADRDFAVYKNGQRIWSGSSTYGSLEYDYYVDSGSIRFEENLPEGTMITVEVF